MFTATQFSSPYEAISDSAMSSAAATDVRYTGSAFTQQTAEGLVIAGGDRVDFTADITADIPTLNGSDIPADNPSTTAKPGLSFGGIQYGEPVAVDAGRPAIGFPLGYTSDEAYSSATGDYTNDTIGEAMPSLVVIGERQVSEKPIQTPSRDSSFMAEVQPVRPWDIALGSWPWSGDKVALQRPLAAMPKTFDTPIDDAIPSPGGSFADNQTGYDTQTPQLLTFRVPVEPWDTADNGQYVDSGQ